MNYGYFCFCIGIVFFVLSNLSTRFQENDIILQPCRIPDIVLKPFDPTSDPMVFVIGFHETGTQTYATIFLKNGISAVQNDTFNGQRFPNKSTLCDFMTQNVRENRLILDGLDQKYRFYSDFGREVTFNGDRVPWYRLLADQYPGSKFILPIRNINRWLRSRFTHWQAKRNYIPQHIRQENVSVTWNGTSYSLLDYDEETAHILLLKSWSEEWYQYMCAALHFFHLERKEISTDLLLFDIEIDGPQKIINFAAGFGIDLNAKHFEHHVNTKEFVSPGFEEQFKKWDNITKPGHIFEKIDVFGSETERILTHCLAQSYLTNRPAPKRTDRCNMTDDVLDVTSSFEPRRYHLNDECELLQIQRFARNIPVTFIHVGKAGGSSVNSVLHMIFRDYKEVHTKMVQERHLIDRQIILVIRDPLSRFQSAYKWRKHMQPTNGQEIERKIFECYPSLSELGEHCLENTTCAELLRNELSPNQTVWHLGMGLEYYLKNVTLDLYKENLYVLQNERLNDDFNDVISELLGFRVDITLPRKKSEYPEKDDFLPLEYRENVNQLLERNYRVYNEIKYLNHLKRTWKSKLYDRKGSTARFANRAKHGVH